VPLELIVNGEAVARQEIVADGALREVSFETRIAASSWVALRILPSSHSNAVFVTVGGKPVRLRASAEWLMKAVERCYEQKVNRVRLAEQGEMKRAYDFARAEYERRRAEAER
jgi:hypothetical protein